MEYVFTTADNQNYIVELPMEFMALSKWLSCELGNDKQKIAALIDELNQLCKNHNNNKKWIGHEYTLVLQNKEVQIYSNLIFSSLSEDEAVRLTEENLSLYDEESFSEAGLEDIIKLLTDYLEFMS
ncbi:YacL family protein [Thorsellia anophelis]|uniref:Uncharacterized protein n=1 Tax=Thorsellia anophelis DSM 18579 TaxID=1123402 RepID=A0A1I0DUN0_9GAMM|nr:YacL family protein [Thorsellia anophelis]SET36327.1 Uncharacterised protein family (UPF0231) [Thorsellia anophelis DSM 18579]